MNQEFNSDQGLPTIQMKYVDDEEKENQSEEGPN